MALYHTSRPPTTASLETGASSVKQHLIALLRQAGARWRAEAVAQCASEFWALRCAHGHVVQAIPVEWCRYRLCPDCARRRQTRAFNRILPAMRTLQRRYPHNRWVLITLTLPSTHEHVKKIIARFKRWFAKLRRASQWKDCIRGGVYSIEVTYHPDTGWHVHAHLLAARMAWWDQADLTAAWRHASEGNGQIVDMRDRDRDVRSGRGAVLKYLFKPPNLRDWGPPQVAQFDQLTRLKLRECYGALRGLAGTLEADEDEDEPLDREPEAPLPGAGDPCPACGLPLACMRMSAAALKALVWVVSPAGLAMAQSGYPP